MNRNIFKFTIKITIIAFVCLCVMNCNKEDFITSGICGKDQYNLLTWQFNDEDGVLTIKGNGYMINFSTLENHPWAHLRKKIKTVIIDQGVKNIGAFAFNDCYELTSLTIPNSVLAIEYAAFFGCSLTSVFIPSSVISIESFAFIGNHLTDFDVDVKNIHYSSFNGVLYNKLQDTLICYPGGKTEIVTFPNTATTITSAAFYGCQNITSIEIPNSIVKIEDYALSSCPLTSLIIGNSDITIGELAFNERYLKSITCKGFNPPNIVVGDRATFYSVPANTPVYIPSGALSAYQNSNWGKVFSNFIEEL